MADEIRYGYIYIMWHPSSEKIYIGKTENSLNKRLNSHIYGAKRSTHKAAWWIKSIINKGSRPCIALFEKVPVSELNEREEFWVAGFKDSYWEKEGLLLNDQDGGGGWTKGKKFSEEHRKKLSESHKGYKQSETHKLNRIKSRKESGEWFSDVAKENISKGKLGIPCSEAAKEASSRLLSGAGNGSSKLTQEQVSQIRSRFTENKKELAKEFNISYDQIRRILNNTAWKV